jgi:predicted ArsR family transcriptional regulator
MEGTRLKILQILQKNHQDTVDGLSKAIGLAPATIRRHLDILQRDRLVDYKEVRKKTGRPEYSFFLTENGQEALPKDYDRMLNLIVAELAEFTVQDTSGRSGNEILEQVFLRLSDKVKARHAPNIEAMTFDQRRETLISLLDSHDFYPEATGGKDNFELRLMNCPFRSLALQNKSVCSFDHALITSILGVSVKRLECVHDGAPSCLYQAARKN